MVRTTALILAAAVSSTGLAQTIPTNQRSADGRYQMFFSPHMRADTFLVDTATGRIWRMVNETGGAGDVVFQAVEVETTPAPFPKR